MNPGDLAWVKIDCNVFLDSPATSERCVPLRRGEAIIVVYDGTFVGGSEFIKILSRYGTVFLYGPFVSREEVRLDERG
jgi:hypothetical protein